MSVLDDANLEEIKNAAEQESKANDTTKIESTDSTQENENNNTIENTSKDVATSEAVDTAEPVHELSLETTDTPNSFGSTVILPPDDDKMLVPDGQGGTKVVDVVQDPEYKGNGFIIEPKPAPVPPSNNPFIAPGVMPETTSAISDYIKELDVETAKEKELAEKRGFGKTAAEPNVSTNVDDTETQEQFDDKYSKAIVMIDKSGMGQVINFTDAERQKLERVKKIRLEEIEVVKVSSFNVKKAKKNTIDQVLKHQPSVHTTPVILSASGYTAVMKGCSTYELIALMTSSQNTLIDTRAKWTLLHEKIESTSIGDMDFDTFLKVTAAVDYNTLVYGVLCSTYPDDDKITLECPKCKKPIEHLYSTRSLIRAEKMTEKMQQLVAFIVDSSHTSDGAKNAHANSAFNTIKAFHLPVSGYVVELHVQSAFDLINTSIKGLQENKDERLNQAAVMSTAVNCILIPDPESTEGEYLSYDEAIDVSKIIYALPDTDILVLTKQTEKILDDLTFEFGLMDVKCRNAPCDSHQKTIPFDIESILFYRYQQAMNTKIE